MTNPFALPLVVIGSLALGGCVASLAATAARLAIQSTQRPPVSNAHLKAAATQACTTRAAAYGAVSIIDVEQRKVDRLVVWGTVTDSKERRSFECHFTTVIASFTVRAIKTQG